jgi:hypothetical protein
MGMLGAVSNCPLEQYLHDPCSNICPNQTSTACPPVGADCLAAAVRPCGELLCLWLPHKYRLCRDLDLPGLCLQVLQGKRNHYQNQDCATVLLTSWLLHRNPNLQADRYTPRAV